MKEVATWRESEVKKPEDAKALLQYVLAHQKRVWTCKAIAVVTEVKL